MHFIIISKKPSFDDKYINDEILNTKEATSLIANSVDKIELDRFIVYIYGYNQIYEECEGYSFYSDENNIFIVNGILNIDDKPRNENIVELFENIDENTEIIGDYQIISLDKEGNGFCKKPLSSVKKLFFYEDDFCSVISSEIKLIVDGVSSFTKSSFAHNYDLTYMYDTFHSGALLKYPRHTIFKNIKRILPFDELLIKNFNFLVVENEKIPLPKWFRDMYFEDKDKLYDWYYNKLIIYSKMLLSQYKDNISQINIGLTGGFDSRLSVLILNSFCDEFDIKLNTFTSGNEDHPDVVIAKQVAECLDLNWTHSPPVGRVFPACQNQADYSQSFYLTQGDFDSRNFVERYRRNLINSKSFSQRGMGAYKRATKELISSGNRWYARTVTFMSNFFYPLFFTDYELWFGRLYNELGNRKLYKEFIYNILKRGDSRLLDIPFAGDYLPQVDVKGLDQNNKLATIHKRKPFYWDYEFILEKLKPCLKESYYYLSNNQVKLLEKANINELDFQLLKGIKDEIERYREDIDFGNEEIINNLIKKFELMKKESLYPQNKSFVEFKQDKNYGYVSRLTQWMDYACAADVNSYVELEKNSKFKIEQDEKLFEAEHDIIKNSKMFDEEWYIKEYSIPDYEDPIFNYLRVGVEKGYNPSKYFDSKWYLNINTDVKRAGLNPLIHYIKYGQYEARAPKLIDINELENSKNKVFKGLNNYLFKYKDKYDEINQHFNKNYKNKFKHEKFIKELNSTKKQLKRQNIDFYNFIIPDRSIICKSKLPFKDIILKRNIDYLNNVIVDFSDEFNFNHYFKHDSHLNLEGYKLFVFNCLKQIDSNIDLNKYNELINNNGIIEQKTYHFDLLNEECWESMDLVKNLKPSMELNAFKNKNCIETNDKILPKFKKINAQDTIMLYSNQRMPNRKALIFYDGQSEFIKEYFSLYFKELFIYPTYKININLVKWFKPDCVIRIFDEKALETIYKK